MPNLCDFWWLLVSLLLKSLVDWRILWPKKPTKKSKGNAANAANAHLKHIKTKYQETYLLPHQMFSTVKRCIHTKFGWLWSSELSASNKFSLKSVKNWNFAGPQKASKQAETNDVLNRSESLTSWEFKFFWVLKSVNFYHSNSWLQVCWNYTN